MSIVASSNFTNFWSISLTRTPSARGNTLHFLTSRNFKVFECNHVPLLNVLFVCKFNYENIFNAIKREDIYTCDGICILLATSSHCLSTCGSASITVAFSFLNNFLRSIRAFVHLRFHNWKLLSSNLDTKNEYRDHAQYALAQLKLCMLWLGLQS